MRSKQSLIGAEAENKVEKYLKKNNFTILHRNFTTKYGEIDIIVKKNNFIRFVEVKKRNYIPTDIFEIIPKKKIHSLIKTSKIFITKNNLSDNTYIFEFDLAIINNKNEINYYKNFFEV
jgi:putative endonuclease